MQTHLGFKICSNDTHYTGNNNCLRNCTTSYFKICFCDSLVLLFFNLFFISILIDILLMISIPGAKVKSIGPCYHEWAWWFLSTTNIGKHFKEPFTASSIARRQNCFTKSSSSTMPVMLNLSFFLSVLKLPSRVSFLFYFFVLCV